ncbi:MAG: hypothetical protein RLY78_2167 [Pseudomonadota bacterium]
MPPEYQPPHLRPATMAAGAAPLLVLLAFVLLIGRWVEPDTALVSLAGLVLWVAVELHRYERGLRDYDRRYAARHLDGQPEPRLQAWARAPELDVATREVVQRYLDGDGRLTPEPHADPRR